MMNQEITSQIIPFIAFIPLCILLSRDSLYYYAVKYNCSNDDLSEFIQNLAPPFRIIYAGHINKLTDRNNQNRVSSLESLQIRRIFTLILPLLLIIAALVGFLGTMIRQEDANIPYILHLSIMIPILVISWRFGHKLVKP